MSLLDPALFGFGSPGFSSVFTGSAGMDFENSGGDVNYYDCRLLAPLFGKKVDEQTFIGASFAYGYSSLDVNGVSGVDDLFLSTVSLQMTAARFPKSDEGWMGLGIISPGIASDFDEVSGDDFAFRAIGVVGYQFSPSFTFAAVGVYNYSIGESTAFPGLGVIWRPTDSFTVQLTPPILAVGWNLDADWTFSLSAYPAGGSWDVDQKGTGGQVEAVKLSLFRAGVGAERRFGENFRITAQLGMNFGGELELRDGTEDEVFSEDIDPSPFGLLGVKYAF